jgi:hypothetical protein
MDNEGSEGSRSNIVQYLLPILVSALLVVLLDLVRDRVAALGRYTVRASTVGVAGVSAGFEQRAGELLGSQRYLDRSRSILDPDLASAAAATLSRHAWVKRVSGVRRRFPDTLEVHLEMREPVAVVCVGSERLAVDAQAVVLERDSQLGLPHHPEIRVPGATMTRVPLEGRAFGQSARQEGHDAVLEALAVLADIRAQGNHPALESTRIVEIVAGESGRARRGGDSDIRLVLEGGVPVHWGRSSLAPLATLEPGAKEKLDNLLLVMRTYPGLLGVSLVDLHLPDAEVALVK